MRKDWENALVEFCRALLPSNEDPAKEASTTLLALIPKLRSGLPEEVLERRSRLPAAFHSQSLAAKDALELSERFVNEYPDRERPILVVGLRTAGLYFGTLISAHLRSKGYENVHSLSIRPKRGTTAHEEGRIARSARQHALTVIVDEPLTSGVTVAKAVNSLCRRGINLNNVVGLFPNHPSRKGWKWEERPEFAQASQIKLILLEAPEWYKNKLLEPEAVELRLQEYFQERGYRSATLTSSAQLEYLRAFLKSLSSERGHIQFKQLFEVRLEGASGDYETRYVLAKSTGWGWYGYAPMIIAGNLSEFVTPVLGMREGILYSEWILEPEIVASEKDERKRQINRLASYVAARVQRFRLDEDFTARLVSQSDHVGIEELAKALSGCTGTSDRS